MPDITPVTIKLKHPVAYGDETISELTFSRRVRMADMLEFPGGGDFTVKDMCVIISKLANVDRQVIYRLEAEDIGAVMEAAGPFLPSGAGMTGR